MRIVRSILYFLLSAMGLVLNPVIALIFHLLYDGDKKRVPPIKEKLLLMSATALAKKIRSREVKSEDVLQAFIARAREVNPIVNAYVAERFEAALSEAREIDKILDSGNIPAKYSPQAAPFLGVPLSVKEAFATIGMPNTSGLVSRKGTIASDDCPVVANLKQAGMIPFLVTNISELCMWYESSNNVYGRTKNAYDPARIVGGSSGGEGCIISSGASVAGLGSDIGGSIRMPAFFNGIYGHRPSKGIVCNDGQHPPATGGQVELLSTGPMCRYAEDLLPLLKVMAGEDASERIKLNHKVDVKKVRIFSMEDDGGSLLLSKMDPQLREAHKKAVRYLTEQSGVAVKPVQIRRFKYSLEMWSAKMSLGQGTAFSEFMAGERGSVNCFIELLKWMVRMSDHTLPAIELGMAEKLTFMMESNNRKLVQMLQKLDEELKELLGEDGVLLYPSHPKIAPYHNEPLVYPMNYAYTAIFNALGLPVTQCPLGLSREGLPVGFQIVSCMNNDRLTIAVAKELEKGLGGWVPAGGTDGL